MPWDDPDQYVKHSPLYFAGKLRRPPWSSPQAADPGSDQLLFALRSRNVESRRLPQRPLRPPNKSPPGRNGPLGRPLISAGRSAPSITRTSTGPLIASSLNPSWSCSTAKMVGSESSARRKAARTSDSKL